MKRVIYVTGSRADYGPARSILRALHADPDIDLQILVTGMHLDAAHGETWLEIEADGLTISEKVKGRADGDSLTAMAGSVGAYLEGMSPALARARPDLVLLLGDRGEMLAGAVAAAYQNFTVAHLCGGSQSGSIDDSVRHAITKFAHYHWVSEEAHARRVLQMGEDPASVEVVGLPGGDLNADVTHDAAEVRARYGLPEDQPYLLVIQHAVSHQAAEAGAQITETLEAVRGSGLPALLANPNDDAGGREILARMTSYATRYETLRILEPPRSRAWFASIMAHAGALVGNSSSGTVEAMSIPVPVVNIGERQRGRESGSCMLQAGHDRTEISAAIQSALYDADYRAKLSTFASGLIDRQTTPKVVDAVKRTDPLRGAAPKTFFLFEGRTA